MIQKTLQSIRNVFSSKPEEQDITVNMDGGVGGSWTVQCSIDDTLIDCRDLQEDYYDEGESFKRDALNYYTGVPAPAYLDDDPWFGPAPNLSEKQLTIKEAYDHAVKDQQILDESGEQESSDIHQKMYEIATKGGHTTVQRDPIGGSENFQTGPGGWMSGNGNFQFN
tara:strand:+ start:1494 stop:1994 length:501 start_codon:yes stop_codon:yes gene_type:complete